MPITWPTQAAHTWDTVETLGLRPVYEQLLYPHRLAKPTLRLLWENRREKVLGPTGEFDYDIVIKQFSPNLSGKTVIFSTDGLDDTTKSRWSPVYMERGTAINDVDWERWNGSEAKANHTSMLVDAIHGGMSDGLNYLLFWDWNSADVSGQGIDVSTQLSGLTRPPEEFYINGVTAISRAPNSIPMLTRKYVSGHTRGGISAANLFWRVTNTDSTATITRSAAGDNIDCVTNIVEATCVELDVKALRQHLSKVSQGIQYQLYAACPSDLYGQLEDFITSLNFRNVPDPLADLGIMSSITWKAYNTVFYEEPMMTALWPYSIFFWDPTCLYLQFETSFAPKVYPWEHIPGSNMRGTGVFQSYQVVCPDPAGVSAMHGYVAS